MRERVEKTKALIEFAGYRGDMHMHTNHSDGSGTVDEMVRFRDEAGLDYIFVTDHYGLTHKRECKKHDRCWWGQEPGTEHHHLGILNIERKFEPARDLAADYAAVIDRGGFPFIPHPTGWFPVTRYTEEQMASLDVLGERFTIEIINGANQIFDCWDITDEMSVELWDDHLKRGKFVTALGNTDTHHPHAVGDVWTGVHPDEFSREGVVDALRQGRAFVSDAPIIDMTVEVDGTNIAGMGGVLHTSKRPLTVRVLAADSAGLNTVTLLRDGEAIRSRQPAGEVAVSTTIADDAPVDVKYYRLECRAIDGRRAFTNPVYIRS